MATGINISQARATRLAKDHKVYLCPETGFWVQTKRLSHDIFLTGDKLETIPSTAFRWVPGYDPDELEA